MPRQTFLKRKALPTHPHSNMSRKRVPVMTFHDVPHSDDESQPVPPPLNHAVTECAIDDQGGVATSNYRVSLHESHSSSPPPDWSTHLFMDGQPERSYDVNDEGEPIFPDYIHFLDGLVPEALKKCRKHQSVSNFFKIALQSKLTVSNRTIHSRCGNKTSEFSWTSSFASMGEVTLLIRPIVIFVKQNPLNTGVATASATSYSAKCALLIYTH